MHNDQEHNSKKIFGLLKHGAGGVTLGLGTSSLILVVTTAIALVAIATTAWLASNREVDSGSMADLTTDSFEVGVVTPTVNGVEQRDPAVENNAILALATPGSNPENMVYANNFWSNETNAGVICGLKISGMEGRLRPGATGTLEFLIKPAGGDHAYSAQMSIAALLKKLDNDGKVVQDQQGNDEYVLLRPGEATGDRARAMALLKGHILFFGATPPANRIIPETTTILIRTASGDPFDSTKTYKVTLNWQWPQRYSDLLTILGQETISQAEAPIYLENGTGSIGYDNGDQTIGTHISHVAVEFQIQPESELLTGSNIVTVTATEVS